MNTGRASCGPLAALAVVVGLLGSPGWAVAEYEVFVRFALPDTNAPVYIGSSTDEMFRGSNGWSRVQALGGGVVSSSPLRSPWIRGLSGLSLAKVVDAGSPRLFQAHANRGFYGVMQLVLRAQGPLGPQIPPLSHFRLKDVIIREITTAGSRSDAEPMEVLTFNCREIQWSAAGTDGAGFPEINTAFWDVAKLLSTGPGPAPGATLSPPALPDSLLGQPYSQTFMAGGITPGPFTYQLQSGRLPPGLSLTSAGALIGMPTTPGSYTFKVGAHDPYECFAERSYTLAVVATCSLPARLTDVTFTESAIRFRLVGMAGCTYQVEKADVVNGPWKTLGGNVTAGAGGTFDFTDKLEAPHFYRAISVP